MDFEKERRYEVIEYIQRRFSGRAYQIAVYGYYKVNNLANDLAKVLEIPKDEITQAKKILEKMYPELPPGQDTQYEEIMTNKYLANMEFKYGFVKHFSKLCGQVRYIGKHAGGVAISCGQATEQFAIIKSTGKNAGMQTCYDLSNLDYLKVLKMDILGLNTLTITEDIKNCTGIEYSEKMLEDKNTFENFKNGNTTGIFQFDKTQAKDILRLINADNIQDVIAATALNRPAPLSMGMHEQFADAKHGNLTRTLASRYLKDTYGCIIYQEDIIKIGKGLSDISWNSIDKIMKGLKETTELGESIKKELESIRDEFVSKAIKKHPKLKSRKDELEELFELMTGGYLFNRGHAAGYGLLSAQQMYYKTHYPLEFWCMTLKNESDEYKRKAYEVSAVNDGCIIIPADVNSKKDYEIVEYGGGKCIKRGLRLIKGIGPKAAQIIEDNGPYKNRKVFYSVIENNVGFRIINKRVQEKLDNIKAFDLTDDEMRRKIVKENRYLKGSTLQIR